MKKNTTLFAFTMIILLGVMLCIPLTSAWFPVVETTAQTAMTESCRHITLEGKPQTICTQKTADEISAQNYPDIKVVDWVGFGGELMNAHLSKHTASCSDNCESRFTITTAERGKLIDSIRFEGGVPISYEFYIVNGEQEVEVNDYENICHTIISYPNGTDVNDCSVQLVGTHLESQEVLEQLDITQEQDAGTYEVVLKGKKSPYKVIDWIISSQGMDLGNAWAVWGAGTSTKQTSFETIDDAWDFANQYCHGQTFNVSTGSFVLSNLSLYGRVSGTVGVYLWNWTGGTRGNLLKGVNVTFPSSASWFNVSMNVNIVNFTEYGWGVCTDATSRYIYGDSTSATYPAGVKTVSSDYGVTWSDDATRDLAFMLWSTTAGGSITLNSPADGAATNNPTFNCTATQVGANIVNVSLVTNSTGTWKINLTQAGSGTTTNAQFQQNFSDANILWNCRACDSDGDCAYSNTNRTLQINQLSPIVTILYPTSSINFASIGTNLSLNYSINELFPNNCWFQYANQNFSTSCTTNSSFIVNNSYKQIILYANDTGGNVASSVVNWNYTIFQNSINYQNPTYYLQSNPIIANLTFDNVNYNSISASMIYNGTSYPATIATNGNQMILSATPTLSYFNTNKNYTFYFNITLSGINTVNFITSSNVQQVYTWTVDNCVSNTYQILNYTMYDEDNNTIINMSLDNPSIEYYVLVGTGNDLQTSTNKLTFSGTVLSNNLSICIPNSMRGENLTMESKIRYNSIGRVLRYNIIQNYHFLNLTSPLNIALLDLLTTRATSFQIHYTSSSFINQEGYLLTIQRFFTGDSNSNKTTETSITSGNGIAEAYLLANDAYYQVIVSKNGDYVETFNIQQAKCSVAPCSIEISTPSSGGTDNNYGSGSTETDGNGATYDEGGGGVTQNITIGSQLTYSYSFNNVTFQWTYTYSKKNAISSNILINLFYNNGTFISSKNTSGQTGLLSFDLSPYQNKTLIFNVWQDGRFIQSFPQYVSNPIRPPKEIINTIAIMGAFMFLAIALLAFADTTAMLIVGFFGFIFVGIIGLFVVGTSAISFAVIATFLLITIGVIIWKLNSVKGGA